MTIEQRRAVARWQHHVDQTQFAQLGKDATWLIAQAGSLAKLAQLGRA